MAVVGVVVSGVVSLAAVLVSWRSSIQAQRTATWSTRYSAHLQDKSSRAAARAEHRRAVERAVDAVRLLSAYNFPSADPVELAPMTEAGFLELRERANEAVQLLIAAQHHPSEQVRAVLAQLTGAVRPYERGWAAAQNDIEPVIAATRRFNELGVSLDTEPFKNLEPAEQMSFVKRERQQAVELLADLTPRVRRTAELQKAFRAMESLSERALTELRTWEQGEEYAVQIAEPRPPPSWQIKWARGKVRESGPVAISAASGSKNGP